jgi:hypothetical protein
MDGTGLFTCPPFRSLPEYMYDNIHVKFHCAVLELLYFFLKQMCYLENIIKYINVCFFFVSYRRRPGVVGGKFV